MWYSWYSLVQTEQVKKTKTKKNWNLSLPFLSVFFLFFTLRIEKKKMEWDGPKQFDRQPRNAFHRSVGRSFRFLSQFFLSLSRDFVIIIPQIFFCLRKRVENNLTMAEMRLWNALLFWLLLVSIKLNRLIRFVCVQVRRQRQAEQELTLKECQQQTEQLQLWLGDISRTLDNAKRVNDQSQLQVSITLHYVESKQMIPDLPPSSISFPIHPLLSNICHLLTDVKC